MTTYPIFMMSESNSPNVRQSKKSWIKDIVDLIG